MEALLRFWANLTSATGFQMKNQVIVLRAKPHGINREKQFLGGIASIGWPTERSLENLNREEVDREVRRNHHNVSNLAISQIHRFVSLPVGSYIITPSYENRDIHLFKSVSSYKFEEDWKSDDIGNPHTLEVEFIKTVPREVFPEQIRRSLLAAKRTVTNFTKYADQIFPVFQEENLSDYNEIPTEPVVEKEARQVLRELLKSENDEVRLKAALALLDKKPD